LRALVPTERAECEVARPDGDFLAAFAAAAALPGEAPPEYSPGSRALRDRRGSGFAGVVGDLLSSGEPVLGVCADVSLRRGGLEQLVAGIAARVRSADCGALALASWDELAADPRLAEPYAH